MMSVAPGQIKVDYDKLFIDGTWTVPGAGAEAVINPATEQEVGSAPA